MRGIHVAQHSIGARGITQKMQNGRALRWRNEHLSSTTRRLSDSGDRGGESR